jgi:hypothetical protein
MMVASVARFCRREPHTTARRVLLPYSVITIIVNTAFVVGAMIGEDSAHGKHPFMEEIKSCSVGDVFYRLFLTIPIVWNDALFVRVAALLTPHNDDRARSRCTGQAPSMIGSFVR